MTVERAALWQGHVGETRLMASSCQLVRDSLWASDVHVRMNMLDSCAFVAGEGCTSWLFTALGKQMERLVAC